MVLVALVIAPDSTLAASAKSKLSTYTNWTYGFSLRYPSDWHLNESDHAEVNWGYLGPVRNARSHSARAVIICVGTLEEPSVSQPEAVMFKRGRRDWDLMAGAVPEFETMPPPRKEHG